MTPREVWTDLAAYRAATAELAPRVRPGTGVEAIRVVEGRGAWWERLVDASAFVVDEPDPAPVAAHDRLAAIGVPVAVVRRRLRADIVADAGAEALALRHIVIDAWGGRTDAAALLRDAVGWARVLAGGPLSVVDRADATAATTLALRGPGGVGVSVTRAIGGGVGGALTATALGTRRLEVRVDSASPLPEVAFDDEEGRRIRPVRRESPERLALRRILDATEAGAAVSDLAELAADDAVLRHPSR
ncbi:hypothetical protein [Microbacterium enclense]|uniref:Uncharacterized protein n=1 Tax=Microbacterium enclense TaxID=993073 RepID=A0A1G6ILF3_9MICO|nr:hypothetical protein [Microbacterium enclense]KSU54612.1 hypothetical protein AS029_06500 [Microbacterium enclense]SDC07250.1 hypothetical protein SAMN05216418_1557 [Microbacterium enclense]